MICLLLGICVFCAFWVWCVLRVGGRNDAGK